MTASDRRKAGGGPYNRPESAAQSPRGALGRPMVTPADWHYESALELVELVRQKRRAGRPVRLALFNPADVAAVLMVTAEVAALAAAELDRLQPDGPPFIDRLRMAAST